MGFRNAVTTALFVFAIFFQPAFAAINVKLVTELDRFEPFDGHVFHAGHLWVGRSRKDLASYYRLEVYDPAGNLVSSQELKHSARYLYPYGDSSVIVVGIAANPNQSFYTIAEVKNKKVSVAPKAIPASALADRWAGRPGKHFFTDPGGLDEGGPLSEPLKTIFTVGSFGPRYLKAKIRGPSHPVIIGNSLYVLEHPNIMDGGKNVVRVDLSTEVPTKIFAQPREYLQNLVVLSNNRLAATEYRANEVLLIDAQANKHVGTVKVPEGSPKALAQLGKCLVVGSEKTKKVSFFDLNSSDHKMLAQWDLSTAGDKFMGIRNLAVDPKSGRVYARSAYPCNIMENCPAERNSVIVAEEEGSATFNACRTN